MSVSLRCSAAVDPSLPRSTVISLATVFISSTITNSCSISNTEPAPINSSSSGVNKPDLYFNVVPDDVSPVPPVILSVLAICVIYL